MKITFWPGNFDSRRESFYILKRSKRSPKERRSITAIKRGNPFTLAS